ncbi:M14 family metallopeptidase [Caenimonas soli]|uniref:M14 family metallopeptidase n=1 Tax=Caenimonas soli TaxID=2735555 RepID=UPI001556D938|nr:M14 family metallopeptidase [Caenimonas soli]NPC58185.1 DUF2817 domain-containing protein [Caenimonas soli]
MNLESAQQVATTAFSASYCEARRKFLAAAAESRPYESSFKGPSGESLFTDVAWYGPQDAKKVLVLVSGTHGVEGYCGSASQLLFLQAGFQKGLTPSCAVLVVHALNCYGFAWDRRVTAEGVDLNRNFVDFSKPIPCNTRYEELDELLVTREISDEAIRDAEAAIKQYQNKNGEQAFLQGVVSGQYTRPGGLFYGGTEPTEARRTLEQVVKDYDIVSREQVIIVDYHTGLGPYGYGELQCEETSGTDGYERAVKIFGSSVTSPLVGTSSSAPIPGSVDAYWERLLGDRHVYIALEYGTYPRPRARLQLRKDHWLFKYRPDAIDSELGRQIRKEGRAHYYPEFTDWKEMVAWRSHQVHRQAIEAFASSEWLDRC